MTLPLLVGECPSKSGDRYHGFPLSGVIGRRLCEWAGIEPETGGSTYGRFYWPLRDHFDCVNVMERHVERWDASVARARMLAYFAEEDVPPRIVTLGRRAADAVGILAGTWGEWVALDHLTPGVRAAVIPHPSGRNLLYNDEGTRDLARRVLREAMG